MLTLALMLLSATSDSTPEFSDFNLPFGGGVTLQVNCRTHEDTTKEIEEFRKKTSLELSKLRKLRARRKITFEQNNQLFIKETLLANLEQSVAMHRYASYFCRYPFKVPPVEEEVRLKPAV